MPGEENPRILDSMALGFFLCGEYRKAVETQARAIELVPEDDEELRAQLESKLERYRTALSALPPGKTGFPTRARSPGRKRRDGTEDDRDAEQPGL